MRAIKAIILSSAVFLAAAGISRAGIVGPIDQESMICLSCHDSAIAKDVILQVCSSPDCDHPIGVNYQFASISNKGLKTTMLVDAPIKTRLLNNNYIVGCGTCHVPYAVYGTTQENDQYHSFLATTRSSNPLMADPMLVMDNSRSQLCMSCHLK